MNSDKEFLKKYWDEFKKLIIDDRNDEDQLGAKYEELEWAMCFVNDGQSHSLSTRQKEVLNIYNNFHRANKHKMEPIPVCEIPESIKR